MKEKIYLVTSALPYINFFPHIGHIVGCHLPSDIYARFLRICEKFVIHLGGTDEYGTPTEITALKLKISPEELCKIMRESHRFIYNWFEIGYDIFSHTSSNKFHDEVVKDFFLRIFENGYIVEEEQILPYDPKIKKFLADRYVEGICPFCGYEKARGDQCENCGKLLDPKDLKKPVSIVTGEKIEFRKTRHLFLCLDKLEREIKEYIEKIRDKLRNTVYNLAISWIKEGLKKRSITRDLEWGVKVPYEDLWKIIIKNLDLRKINTKEEFLEEIIKCVKSFGMIFPEEEINKLRNVINKNWPNKEKILEEYNYFEVYKNKVLYVWFDAPIGYISFLKNLSSKILVKENKEDLKENVYLFEIDNSWEIKELVEEKIKSGNYFDKELTPEEVIFRINSIIKVKKEDNVVGFIYGEFLGFAYKIHGIFLKENNNNVFNVINEFSKFLKNKEVKYTIIYKFNEKNLKKIGFKEVDFKEIIWESNNSEIFHFLGKDNIPFHIIFWPAMIIASNKYRLPSSVIGMQYLNFEGKKISKSQRIGVFCNKLVELKENPDIWRFYLTYLLPELKDSSFSWEEFVERINKDLIGNYLNFINRVITLSNRNFNGKIKYHVDEEIREIVKNLSKEYVKLMESFCQRDSLVKILELSDFANKYFQEKEPWKIKEKEALEKILSNALYLARAIAILMYPFLPRVSLEVFNLLGLEIFDLRIKNIDKELKEWKVNKPKIILKKIEIEEEKIKKLAEATELEEFVYNNSDKFVKREDFDKMDIVVGKIVEVRDLGEKIYLLKVNVGNELRNIVAGIKKFYSKEELIGKKVLILKNIKPRKIRGIFSEGMLLAICYNNKAKLIEIDESIPEGSKVC